MKILTAKINRCGLPALSLVAVLGASGAELERLKYNNPGLVVDLGVGLWAFPLPMDFNGDGKLDLVVDCPDKPYNGVYVFENLGTDTARNPMPIFKRARRISKGVQYAQVSFVDGKLAADGTPVGGEVNAFQALSAKP